MHNRKPISSHNFFEVGGIKINTSSPIQLHMIHQPTVHVWTKFQLCRPLNPWEKRDEFYYIWKLYRGYLLFLGEYQIYFIECVEKISSFTSVYWMISLSFFSDMHWFHCLVYNKSYFKPKLKITHQLTVHLCCNFSVFSSYFLCFVVQICHQGVRGFCTNVEKLEIRE